MFKLNLNKEKAIVPMIKYWETTEITAIASLDNCQDFLPLTLFVYSVGVN